MNHEKKETASIIGLVYLQGSFTQEELLDLENTLKSGNLSLSSLETPPRYYACLEELIPQIRAYLSPVLIRTICDGIATNALYDSIKAFLIMLRQMAKRKLFSKIQGKKTHTNVAPTIHFDIGQMHVVLPMDIDEEKFKYFVDKAFELARNQQERKETFAFYSKETGELECYTQLELAWKAYEKQHANRKQ